MKDLSKIEQKQLRHLFHERKERLRQEVDVELEDEIAEVPEGLPLREPIIRQIDSGVTQLVIVASLVSPALVPADLDRFLIIAQLEDLDPLICINKVDLLPQRAEAEKIMRAYRKLGCQVILTSAITGEGISSLRDGLEQKRSLLAGPSGAGKSALIKRIDPNCDQKVETLAISLNTSTSEPANGTMKNYDLARATELIEVENLSFLDHFTLPHDEVRFYFSEFQAPSKECDDNACLHLHERDCAIKQGVQDGTISKLRYESYRQIVTSLRQR